MLSYWLDRVTTDQVEYFMLQGSWKHSVDINGGNTRP